MLIYLQAHLKAAPKSRQITIGIDLDGQPWTARISPAGATVRSGEPAAADLTVSATARAFDDLLHNPARLGAALKKRSVRLTGDRATLASVLARLPGH